MICFVGAFFIVFRFFLYVNIYQFNFTLYVNHETQYLNEESMAHCQDTMEDNVFE